MWNEAYSFFFLSRATFLGTLPGMGTYGSRIFGSIVISSWIFSSLTTFDESVIFVCGFIFSRMACEVNETFKFLSSPSSGAFCEDDTDAPAAAALVVAGSFSGEPFSRAAIEGFAAAVVADVGGFGLLLLRLFRLNARGIRCFN